MNALFYHTFLENIGEDITNKVLNFLNNVDNIGDMNQIHNVLIPKRSNLSLLLIFGQ